MQFCVLDAIHHTAYYTSDCIIYITLHKTILNATCWMHFIPSFQGRSVVHSRLRLIAHSQPVWLYPCKWAVKTLKHTPEYALMYPPNCAWCHTPSLLAYMLPSSLWRHSEVHSEYFPIYTCRYILIYTSDCSRCYTPGLLGSMLPCTLSRGKTLPISLEYGYSVCCGMLGPETCWVAGTGMHEQVVYAARLAACCMRHVADGGQHMATEIMASVWMVVWTLLWVWPLWNDHTMP